MANDVTIVVEASLGDTLLKLELAKHAIGELDDAGTIAGKNLGDDSSRTSFSSRIRNLRYELGNMGDRGPLGKIVRMFGNMGSAMLAPLQATTDLTKNMGTLGQSVGVVTGVLASMGSALVIVSGAILATVFAAEALASILGTLTAIVADLVAPLTLLVGLLGGLAAGFVIGAKRAAEGGGKLNEFSKELAKLQSMFGKTSNILAHVFLPYLMELGHAAEHALLFLDRIVKLPLGQAFRAIDTRGTKLLGQFVDRVAEVLGKPIRLAFRVAFDDTAFAAMVSDWWHRFTGFLFGETERKPVEIRPGVFKILPKTVDGVFQPFIEWWDRHHFTKQGIRIGQQILGGILDSNMRSKLVTFFGQVFRDAGRRAVQAMLDADKKIIHFFATGSLQMARDLIRNLGAAVWGKVKQAAGAAWDWISNKIRSIWDKIVSFIEQPLHISIDWPSPPSWLTSLPGGISGLAGSVAGAAGGLIGHTAGVGGSTGRVVSTRAPRGAMGHVTVVQHFHGIDTHTIHGRRQIGAIASRAIEQRWVRSGL